MTRSLNKYDNDNNANKQATDFKSTKIKYFIQYAYYA